MFKFKYGLLPAIFNNFCIHNNAYHRYPTRGGNKLRVPLTKTAMAKNFITKTGVGIWNSLEDRITENLKIGAFKTNLKKFLVENY